MAIREEATEGLHGIWCDVMRDASGRIIWESGWRKNAIVNTCRSLLAGFMAGQGNTFGIQGLQVGAGLPSWDVSSTPAATPAQTALVDPNPFLVPLGSLIISYLSGAVVSGTPTNKLQIVAKLGPSQPPWPDANHATLALREFGLVGRLNNTPVLINYVTHPVINKDPASTLERTLWLTF